MPKSQDILTYLGMDKASQKLHLLLLPKTFSYYGQWIFSLELKY